MNEWKNKLYFGNNLEILRSGAIPAESVDLVYLDPPFNSKANYNILFREEGSGKKSSAQITAFEDTWHWNENVEKEFHLIVTQGPERIGSLMRSYREFLGQSDMMAYITMMAPCLVELHKVLKPSGSIYLHCDPTASHYLKLVLDAVFGPVNFKNEIIWRRTGSHNSAKRFGPIHDTILFYAKAKEYVFYKQYRPYLKGYVAGYFNHTDENGKYRSQTLTGSGTRNGESGKVWRTYDVTSKERHWAFPGALAEDLGIDESDDLTLHEKLDILLKEGYIAQTVDGLPEYRQYLHKSKGVPLQDIWAYQPYTQGVLHESAEAIDQDVKWPEKRGTSERLGYPTQKPEGLLERIILSSSREGEVVFDPFCGGGTTIAVAEHLKRRWIGIDITHIAISLTRSRIRDRHKHKLAPYEVFGVPKDLESAKALALEGSEGRYKFQEWALGEIDAHRWRDKKGADSGVDGYIFFDDEGAAKYKKLLVQVKSGHVKSGDIRDLVGAMKREDATIGVYITLEPPTKPMRDEASTAGIYESKFFPDKLYPRIQIITIEELFGGKMPAYPQMMASQAFKKAPTKEEKAEQAKMF